MSEEVEPNFTTDAPYEPVDPNQKPFAKGPDKVEVKPLLKFTDLNPAQQKEYEKILFEEEGISEADALEKAVAFAPSNRTESGE